LRAQHYTILTKVDKVTCFFGVPQQIIKCSICIQRGKFLSFPLHHLIFFNLHIKHQTKPNVHFMLNYIFKNNETYTNNVMK
jgi:hypothetical protein